MNPSPRRLAQLERLRAEYMDLQRDTAEYENRCALLEAERAHLANRWRAFREMQAQFYRGADDVGAAAERTDRR